MNLKFKLFSIIFGVVLLSCKSKKQTATTSSQQAKSNIIASVVEGLNLGNKAPEIAMASPQGTVITLSSLKGKLVLIDFWASWCGPCRAENPTVVAAYNTYNKTNFINGKGFEVFSVSLDQNLAAWKKAIEKDGLVWPYHVSDLQFWNNAAAQKYGVSGIPTNFLIDGNGIIIARSLRGSALAETIDKFKK